MHHSIPLSRAGDPMRKNGFTLIELLMVISIIAVLAGLLIPIIGYARRLAKEAKCTSQLGTIKASLASFKDANGFYPEKDFSSVFENPSPHNTNEKYLIVGKRTPPGGPPPSPADKISNAGWESAANILWQALQSVDRDNYRTVDALRDPFTGGGTKSHFIRYRPAKYYPLRPAAADLFLIDTEDPPNADSFQLWSAGVDGKDQFGERDNNVKNDDITNWKTP
jgi:prepilin-type N-terminal cleavage/methylation domain-containing protein